MKRLSKEMIESNSDCYEQLIKEAKKRYHFIEYFFYGQGGKWTTISSKIAEFDSKEFDSFFEMLAYLEKELLYWKMLRNDLGTPINTFSEDFPKRLEIFTEVNCEREAQVEKWGVQSHDPITWCAILGEEVGEVMKAAVQAKFEDRDISRYREELIQTAAVCFQMIECFDRN